MFCKRGVIKMLSTKQLVSLVDLLDDANREAIETIIKNLVAINDPDFVKLTIREREKLDSALRSDDFIDFERFKQTLNIAE
jgi:hypothetical protein